MTTEKPRPPAHVDVASWLDVSSRDALGLIAASVAEMVGFGIATVSVVRGAHLVSVAVEGSNDARASLLGLATPLEVILEEVERADDWGRFKFVPHERLGVGPDTGFDVPTYGWIPDIEPLDGPDAWHPLDLLIAPLRAESGEVVGLVSIDLPMSGRRPTEAQRGLLERYAAQTERAVRIALEREALAERLRMAETAREVVRFALSQDDVEKVLDDCRAALLDGYAADDLTIRTYATDDLPSAGTPSFNPPSELQLLFRRVTLRCWRGQRVLELTAGERDDTLLSEAEHRALMGFGVSAGMGRAMIVPIGAGGRQLGHLMLIRKDPSNPWTPDQQAGALDIARDIGQAVLNARNLVREQRLVSQLRDLASYKTQLLSTVSHELKNPLTVIGGHLELLDSADLAPDPARSVSVMGRATKRMGRLIDDLLLLAGFENPDTHVAAQAIDVGPLLVGAVDQMALRIEQRELVVTLDLPDDPLVAGCDAGDVDLVLANLLSNAVKYTPRGGAVTITASGHHDEVEIAVADTGIGISAADQKLLFTEFFRSTNPQAVAQPGTGLGLTICARIAARHGGRIEIDSHLATGSTFRLFLPLAGQAV